jgi:hypothetical protein
VLNSPLVNRFRQNAAVLSVSHFGKMPMLICRLSNELGWSMRRFNKFSPRESSRFRLTID